MSNSIFVEMRLSELGKRREKLASEIATMETELAEARQSLDFTIGAIGRKETELAKLRARGFK